MTSVLAIIIRRFVTAFSFVVVQAILFRQVVFRLLLWPLPGLLVYLIRVCFNLSVETDALGSDVQQFFYTNRSSLGRLGANIVNLVVIAVLEIIRRRSNQVHWITSTSSAIPHTTNSNALHTFTAVVPGIAEAINNGGHRYNDGMIIGGSLASIEYKHDDKHEVHPCADEQLQQQRLDVVRVWYVSGEP